MIKKKKKKTSSFSRVGKQMSVSYRVFGVLIKSLENI